MRKHFEIEIKLNEIKHYVECAKNKIEHYAYGDKSAKQIVVQYISHIENCLEEIKREDGHLNKFVFKDE